VESSWHHRKPYRLSAEMIRRRDGQSPAVRARADQANRRLNQRWRTFDARKKRSTTAAVGVPGAGRLVLVAGRDGRRKRQLRHEQAGVE